MKREVDMDEISDGRLYGLNDMVKVGCDDCKGCSACCQGMGKSVVLDPLDIYRLEKHLDCGFELLFRDKIELNMADGIILPNLRMEGAAERCVFLNEEGRCSIHGARPGICRLFPLGRYYENGGFQYFLQVHECKKDSKTKVKVKNWIDTPDVKENEAFILAWHDLLENLRGKIKETEDEGQVKQINVYTLQLFFVVPYDCSRDFYPQFWERMENLEKNLKF